MFKLNKLQKSLIFNTVYGKAIQNYSQTVMFRGTPVSILLNSHGFTSSLKINFEFKWYVHTAQFLCLMYIGLFKVIT